MICQESLGAEDTIVRQELAHIDPPTQQHHSESSMKYPEDLQTNSLEKWDVVLYYCTLNKPPTKMSPTILDVHGAEISWAVLAQEYWLLQY